MSGTYDSRFSGASDRLAAARDIEPSEYILRPQLSIDVTQPIGRQLISLRGSVGYELHKNNPRFDEPRANVQGSYVTTLGRCQAQLGATYRVSQNELDRLDEPGIKNLQQVHAFTGGATCATATGLLAGVTAQHTEVDNSATIQKESDSTSNSGSVQVGYGNPTLGRLSVVYTYAESDLPKKVNIGGPIGDGFKTQTVGISAERDVGSRLSVRGTYGRTTLERDFTPPGADRKVTSTTYSAAGTYRLGSRLTFDFSANRGFSPTGRAGKLYDINTSLEGQAKYQLGSRFVVSAGHRNSKVKSNIDTSIPVDVISNARTNSTYGGVRFRQSSRVSMALDVRYDDRKTNLPLFNYTATRVTLSTEVGF